MLRVYAIGDIHGELGALCRLITECERDADGRSMRLVFIGDYIDRGPDSRSTNFTTYECTLSSNDSYWRDFHHDLWDSERCGG